MTLTGSALAKLRDRHRHVPVLSLYLPVEDGGPRTRAGWRLHADRMLETRESESMGMGDRRRTAFDQARRLVVEALDRDGIQPPPGTWALLATPNTLIVNQMLEERLGDLARFEPGPRIAPLLGLAELERRGVIVVLDAERARLFSVNGPEVVEARDMIAPRQLEEISDVGVSKRASPTSGVRGQTGKDRAKKTWANETRKFARDVNAAAREICGPEGYVVFGGTHRMSRAFASEVGDSPRVGEASSLALHLTEVEVRHAAGSVLAELHRRAAEDALQRVEQSVGNEGRGCLGWNDTQRALRASAVQTLFIAEGLIRAEPDRAEAVVGSALDQGGAVVRVYGSRASELVDHHGGVAATLRYPVAVVSPAAD